MSSFPVTQELALPARVQNSKLVESLGQAATYILGHTNGLGSTTGHAKGEMRLGSGQTMRNHPRKHWQATGKGLQCHGSYCESSQHEMRR